MTDTSDLWSCPDCQKRFVTENMWHSCGDHSVEEFLTGTGELGLAFWDRLVAMVNECGPFEFHAAKTRIGFMVRTRFAGVTSVSDRGVTVSFWLKDHIQSRRFSRVEHVGGRDWIYHLRLTDFDDFDDELQEWLCRAYRVGCQEQ